MEAMIAVYNPDDEELTYRFNGKDYTLKPEDVTEVPRSSLGVMLTQIGEFGATPIPNGTPRTDFDKIIKVAKARWQEGVRKWAENLVLDSARSNKERTDVGLAPVESPEVVQARAWLKKQGHLK
jgi:hypothetical protein